MTPDERHRARVKPAQADAERGVAIRAMAKGVIFVGGDW